MQAQTQPPAVSFRPVDSADHATLLKIYASTREEEMLLVPWTEEERQVFLEAQLQAQQSHYSQKYPTAQHDIIMLEGEAIGRLYVARLEDELRIVDITLLPEHRGLGIGTQLIKQLMNEASNVRKPLRIYVETFNRSLKLFERLGFYSTAEHGIHLLMERSPDAVARQDQSFDHQ